MIEITRQSTGTAKLLESVADAAELVAWANEQEGLYFTIAAKAGGGLEFQAGGTHVDTVYPEIGQWVVFDGDRFYALTVEEFEAKGYSVPE